MGGTIFSQIEDFGPVIQHALHIKNTNIQKYEENLRSADCIIV